tara:strand:- start:122 stop:463 length:342 start_codon:yes stop_codon:yes gene_type:complete
MKPIQKIWTAYMLIIIFMIVAGQSFSQVVVTHFNAKWNEENKAIWVDDLEECEINYVQCPKKIKKHKVKVLPTIIVFKDGEELYRFEADLSFKMVATREELQKHIDKLIKDRY